jgi:hypothetical protein
MMAQWGYIIALVAVVATCLPAQTRRRTALAFFGAWALQTAIVYATGNVAPWMAFAVIDISAAVIVILPKAYRMQSLIATILSLQAIISCAYGLSGNADAVVTYLTYQTYLGWLVIGLLGAWSGGSAIRTLYIMDRRNPYPNNLAGVSK